MAVARSFLRVSLLSCSLTVCEGYRAKTVSREISSPSKQSHACTVGVARSHRKRHCRGQSAVVVVSSSNINNKKKEIKKKCNNK